jgi:hypothetical protein
MPEEINRIVIHHLAITLFSTTDVSPRTVSMDKIHQVSDVTLDAALLFAERAKSHSTMLD